MHQMGTATSFDWEGVIWLKGGDSLILAIEMGVLKIKYLALQLFPPKLL